MLGATLLLVLTAVLGLAFGSFLNVCIVRLPAGLSVVNPRSRCPACKTPIAGRHNIPLYSFAALAGRCTTCDFRIPAQYPLVEAATCGWFLFSVLPLYRLQQVNVPAEAVLGGIVHAAALATFGFLLFGLAVMDWQTGLLPNEFTLGGLAAGIFATLAESFFVPPVAVKTLFTPEEVFISHRLAAAIFGWLLLWSIAGLYRLVRHQPGMGKGDAKLAAMMGSFLGASGLGIALFLGTLLAVVVGVFMVAVRRANGRTRLPFGSFLALGGLVAAIYGERIAAWYRQLFV